MNHNPITYGGSLIGISLVIGRLIADLMLLMVRAACVRCPWALHAERSAHYQQHFFTTAIVCRTGRGQQMA